MQEIDETNTAIAYCNFLLDIIEDIEYSDPEFIPDGINYTDYIYGGIDVEYPIQIKEAK